MFALVNWDHNKMTLCSECVLTCVAVMIHQDQEWFDAEGGTGSRPISLHAEENRPTNSVMEATLADRETSAAYLALPR